MKLSRKVAVVTGGATGIGRAICSELTAQGADVVVGDVQDAEATIEEIHKNGGNAIAVNCDVSSPDEISHLIEAAVENFDGLDILVNNAGIGDQSPFLETSLALWQRCLSINLTGQFLCGQAAARVMASRGGGAIINIASISGQRAGRGRVAYGTSKAGVIMLTRQMAVELAEYNIRVNAVAPGPVDTAQSRSAHTAAQRAAYHRQIPLHRYGNAEEIARTVRFLASADASFITGAVVNVDGGFGAAGLVDWEDPDSLPTPL
jgi:3-oxoacyl-[acyl-carrier protein] reductase